MSRYFLLAGAVFGLLLAQVPASSGAASNGHDFDFELGTWTIHMQRLLHPLSGSKKWMTVNGYVHRVRAFWGGRAIVAELELCDPSPSFRGSLVKLYDPQIGSWNVYWADRSDGTLDPPLVGRFNRGRGDFFGKQDVAGKPVLVRVSYDEIAARSFRTVQAFSADGGKTWEPNLIQTFQRTTLPDEAAVTASGHQRDFDFEFGTWRAHLKRLARPLSGSHDWVAYDGTSILQRLWGGLANVGELDVANAQSRITGLTLRLYDPLHKRWSVYFANADSGTFGTPQVGGFENGRGAFFDRATLDGKPVEIRYLFSNVTTASFRFVQSVSADGGKTWEENWIASFSR